LAKDCRTPSSHVVNVLPSFDVPKPRAFGFRHEKWLAANVTKGADRRVHSAWDKSFGLGKKGGTGHGCWCPVPEIACLSPQVSWLFFKNPALPKQGMLSLERRDTWRKRM